MRTGENGMVVVGNGCAGAECIKALRENGYQGKIHLFSDGHGPIYNPMLSTYFVAGKIGWEALFPYGSNDEFAVRYRVNQHQGSPVTVLDAANKTVINETGLKISYESCLVATGASPIIPPFADNEAVDIYTMRTLADAIRLKHAMAKKPRKALVIGASMVGIKLVEIFHNAGMQVCLADIAPHIFPLAAHPDCAAVLEDRLAEMGVSLRLGAAVEKLEKVPGGIGVHYANGLGSDEADIVVVCIGVRPNISFIDRRQVEIKRGVIVNERMETNMPDLYAAGDVAEGINLLTGETQILGLWGNARYQGRTAGRNMIGINDVYPGSIPHNITHFMGMDFIGIGDVTDYDEMEQKLVENRYIQLFWKNCKLQGANLIDTTLGAGVVRHALAKGLSKNKPSYQAKPVMHDLLYNHILREVENGE